MNITAIVREIRYSRHTHDYDLYLDGRYVGSAATYHEAETQLDEMVYEMLMHQPAQSEAC